MFARRSGPDWRGADKGPVEWGWLKAWFGGVGSGSESESESESILLTKFVETQTRNLTLSFVFALCVAKRPKVPKE